MSSYEIRTQKPEQIITNSYEILYKCQSDI